MDFEPTRSFAYRFSRYVLLPELQQLPQTQTGEPFLLRELAWPLIDAHLTPEQQAIRLKRAKAEGDESMGQIIRFYIPFLAKELGVFVNLGKGLFRSQTEADVSDEDLADAAIDAGEEAAEDFEGFIYAFSFPTIVNKNGPFPIKVGKTTGDVAARVTDQCRASASFEQPVVLASWGVKRVGPTELAIHNTLKARGKHREDAPGREWFDTTVAEIESIIEFVVPQPNRRG
jgi:hypothetical protein